MENKEKHKRLLASMYYYFEFFTYDELKNALKKSKKYDMNEEKLKFVLEFMLSRGDGNDVYYDEKSKEILSKKKYYRNKIYIEKLEGFFTQNQNKNNLLIYPKALEDYSSNDLLLQITKNTDSKESIKKAYQRNLKYFLKTREDNHNIVTIQLYSYRRKKPLNKCFLTPIKDIKECVTKIKSLNSEVKERLLELCEILFEFKIENIKNENFSTRPWEGDFLAGEFFGEDYEEKVEEINLQTQTINHLSNTYYMLQKFTTKTSDLNFDEIKIVSLFFYQKELFIILKNGTILKIRKNLLKVLNNEYFLKKKMSFFDGDNFYFTYNIDFIELFGEYYRGDDRREIVNFLHNNKSMSKSIKLDKKHLYYKIKEIKKSAIDKILNDKDRFTVLTELRNELREIIYSLELYEKFRIYSLGYLGRKLNEKLESHTKEELIMYINYMSDVAKLNVKFEYKIKKDKLKNEKNKFVSYIKSLVENKPD